jgi:hypothetical protein
MVVIFDRAISIAAKCNQNLKPKKSPLSSGQTV